MPSRNIIKTYVENSYYHIYNRGIEKREIFKDEQDYQVFLKYLKESLSPPPDIDNLVKTFSVRGLTFNATTKIVKNFQDKLELLAFCLMPNHFHLLIKQLEPKVINEFMQSFATRYSMYFNKKYNRVGTLFQSVYKASMIATDDYLLHLSRYIHLNPLESSKDLTTAYSSYAEYLCLRRTDWVKTKEILSYFNKNDNISSHGYKSYKKFVEDNQIDSKELLGELTLE